MHRYTNSPCNSLILCVLCCWCGNIYKLKNNRIFVLKLRIFRCFFSNRCVFSIHQMNFPFLLFTSEHIFDSHSRYSDIFYFMFSTFVQTKVRPKKSGTDEGQRHLFMYGEIEECIPCAPGTPLEAVVDGANGCSAPEGERELAPIRENFRLNYRNS